jgi:hypothetical protein
MGGRMRSPRSPNDRYQNLLAKNYPTKVKICTLDPFYNSITFLKTGSYTVQDKKLGSSLTYTVVDRIVSPLFGFSKA